MGNESRAAADNHSAAEDHSAAEAHSAAKGHRPGASDEQARRRMRRQKRSDTRPERVVRSVVSSLGQRYRLDNRDLPGSPDLANRKRAWAIFVHGCFWHAHPGCPKATIPKRNRDFWLAKFEANRERDSRKVLELLRLGYRVITVWECQTRDPQALRKELRELLPDQA